MHSTSTEITSGNATRKYRTALPQLNGELFLTDGGIETTLIFHQGFELPYFAAFDLLKNGEGREGRGAIVTASRFYYGSRIAPKKR